MLKLQPVFITADTKIARKALYICIPVSITGYAPPGAVIPSPDRGLNPYPPPQVPYPPMEGNAPYPYPPTHGDLPYPT